MSIPVSSATNNTGLFVSLSEIITFEMFPYRKGISLWSQTVLYKPKENHSCPEVSEVRFPFPGLLPPLKVRTGSNDANDSNSILDHTEVNEPQGGGGCPAWGPTSEIPSA